ncbi:MAG: PIG-L family deacetylase [Candidatus Nanopelagicales bacterium]|nr:PIG-L family deacetylase [Candidatus Nanopelagicales bacterium]
MTSSNLTETNFGIPEGVTRVLVVTAHPDDVDFGASGTIAMMTQAGISVTYCICTDGDAGGFDDSTDRSQIPGIRRQEQTAAANLCGVTDIHFLGYKDGYLEASHEVQRDIVRVMRKVQPQLVITQSPERNWERLPASHPDHMAAGEATTRALYPAVRNPYAYPELRLDEGLESWTVTWLWLQGHPEPNHWIDMTETFPIKLQALHAHASQTSHMKELEEMLQGWGTMQAQAAGFAEGKLAETFRQIKLPD